MASHGDPFGYAGKRVVVESRGDLWSLPAKQGAPMPLTRTDGVMLALFTTKWRLQGFCEDNPTVRLRELVAAGDN